MDNFSIPKEWLSITRHMDDKTAGGLWRAIMEYVFEGIAPTLSTKELAVCWPIIKDHADKQAAKWERGRVRRTSTFERVPLTTRQRFMILERDGFRCVYCGRSSDEVALEIDHYTPVSKGGASDPDNLVTACRDCNSGKRAHIIGEERKWK